MAKLGTVCLVVCIAAIGIIGYVQGEELSGPNVCSRKTWTTQYVYVNESYPCLKKYWAEDCSRPRHSGEPEGCYKLRRSTCYAQVRYCETMWVTTKYCCKGYEKDGQGGCHMSIMCQDNNGGCQQQCVQDGKKHKCECWPGFIVGLDRTSCIDIDECATKSHGCDDKCHNSDGSYYCSCEKPGYRLAEDRMACVDVNECDYFNGMCEHFCKNKEGAFYCTCAAGFKLVEGFMCEDHNECSDTFYNHMCELCVNEYGSYHCECPEGKVLDRDNRTCLAIKPPGEQTTPGLPGPPTMVTERLRMKPVSEEDEAVLPVAAIAGGVVGALLCIVLVIILIVILFRRGCFTRSGAAAAKKPSAPENPYDNMPEKNFAFDNATYENIGNVIVPPGKLNNENVEGQYDNPGFAKGIEKGIGADVNHYDNVSHYDNRNELRNNMGEKKVEKY